MLFYFIFFKLFLKIISSNNGIKIPFTKLISKNLDSLFNIDIVTNVSIGNPPQSAQLSFSFYSESNLIKGSLFNSQYNENKSITSKKLNISGNSFYYYTYYKTEYINDEFTFEINNDDNKNSNIKINDFLFQLINTTSIGDLIKSGIIGLNIYISGKRNDNFIEQLYKNKIINNKIFFIEYIDDNSGYIYLGEYPHIWDADNYDEKNFIRTKEQFFGRWLLNLDKIKVNNIQSYIVDKVNAKLDFNIKGIIGDIYFKYSLDDNFFTQYLKNKTCFEESYSLDTKTNITIIKCDKSINLKIFPKISFYQNDLNYSFEFGAEELFIKDKDNNYIFLISFYKTHTGSWILGEIFLKKYKLIMECEYRKIGIYKQKKDKDKSPLDITKYIIISFFIILIIIIIVLSYLLIKSYKDKRKIRANELKDNYEYTSEENKENLLGV